MMGEQIFLTILVGAATVACAALMAIGLGFLLLVCHNGIGPTWETFKGSAAYENAKGLIYGILILLSLWGIGWCMVQLLKVFSIRLFV